jgi:hypothetical protein
LPSTVLAEEPSATCTASIVPSGELTPWSTPAALKAAGDAQKLDAASLPVGKAARVTLLPTPDVSFPLRPAKPGGTASFGGLMGVDIVEAGIYRVALSAGAWIDMVSQSNATPSVAHSHGPVCTGIRKVVDFALAPGRHMLQLSGNSDVQITVLVARLS